MENPIVVVAGASGDLGLRIVKALVSRGAMVRALIRSNASSEDAERFANLGATPEPADLTQSDSIVRAIAGAHCVVSALNGLRDVIVERQTLLLDAAVSAGAGRFISSDYSLDFRSNESSTGEMPTSCSTSRHATMLQLSRLRRLSSRQRPAFCVLPVTA